MQRIILQRINPGLQFESVGLGPAPAPIWTKGGPRGTGVVHGRQSGFDGTCYSLFKNNFATYVVTVARVEKQFAARDCTAGSFEREQLRISQSISVLRCGGSLPRYCGHE